MKIKHILTLFCVTLTLAFLLVSCADTSGGGGGETNMNGETNTDETNGDTGDGGDGDGGDGDGGDGGGGDGGDGGGGDGGDGGDGDGGDGGGGDGGGDGDGDGGDGDGGDGDGGDGDGGDGDGDEPEYTGPFEASNVSARQCTSSVSPLNCFISVWKTDHVPISKDIIGVSDTNIVKLPLVEGGTYDFYVNWGDESDVQKITSSDDATHEYATPGEYTIHIAGTIKGWRFYVVENSYGDAVKLLDVTQWGSLSLGNTDGRQFRGAENFNPTATDAPDVSETTSLVSAFNGASNFNADISDWDVSKVTDMRFMFNYASSFNNNGKPLDWGAKTSKVTDMQWMFFGAGVFNQDISAWDVGEVTSMKGMFWGAAVFDQDLSKWNVCNVTVANSANFHAGTSATWTAAEKPNWGMDCPTN